MMLSGLGLWHFLCWDCRPLRWCNIDPDQLVPTENHVGTVREGTMMWTWEPELLHLALLWAAPPVAEVCTEVEAKGTHHQLVFFQVQGFLLALLCGLSTNPGTCHTTPARGPEDGRPAKTRNSKGVAHKMSHPGFGGWWDNLEHSLENNLVTAEHFVCVRLQDGSQFLALKELDEVFLMSLSHWCSVVWGWVAWSLYKWQQIASE